MRKVAVFDTKPYDREFLSRTLPDGSLDWIFLEARLDARSAALAKGCQAACLFVNDRGDAAALEALKAEGVRMLALRSAGYNHVDLKAAARLGLKASRVPTYSPHAVAEHAVALLLALNRKIHRAHQRVKEHDFSLRGLMGWDLYGKTVGIVGAGQIGRIAAEIFRGFGCKVLAHDPQLDRAWARKHGVRAAGLDELLRVADVVSLHLPLTPATHHLIDERRLAAMKPGVHLINTGRGKLVDTGALLAALKSGKVGGVALDVYEEEEGVFFENLSDQILADDHLALLLSYPNVLVTAHQAFFTREAMEQIAHVTSGNLLRYFAKKPFLPGTDLLPKRRVGRS